MPIKFVTPPKARAVKIVGNKRCGEIELEVFGGLTTEEVDLIQEIIWGMETPYAKAAGLAVYIASREKVKNPKGEMRQLTGVEAFEVIANSLNNKPEEQEAKEISIKYAKEIADVGHYSAAYQSARKKATVTAVIKKRNAPDHTHEETLALDSELVDLIYAETVAEEEAQKTGEEDTTPPTEDDLKKQPEANSSKKE